MGLLPAILAALSLAGPATPAPPAETIALRRRYFGAENVNPATGALVRDKVILSWFGVTNFAMAIRGQVVLLDAWVPRGGSSGYVPSSPEELAGLKPAFIFIGHAHFDHAADAVPIAAASGATIVGSAEQCAELRGRMPSLPPPCVEALPPGAPPGTTAPVKVLRGVRARIVKHVHSAARNPDGSDGYHVPVTPPPSTTQLDHPATPEDMAQLVEHAPDAEAGTVLYRFAYGDFSMVWNDSAGPLADDAPDAFKALEALRPVDVQVGAIQGFNQISNGMRDPRMYIEAVHPALFVPAHHDDWAAGITTKGENYRAPLDAELQRIPEADRPQVRFIADPADYVQPQVLTFPVRIAPLRLVARCTRRGRVRVRLRGDRGDLAKVRIRRRGRRVRAVVVDVDGTRRVLRKRAPRC
jgi:hypothetical protein